MILLLLSAIFVLALILHYVLHREFYKLNLPGPVTWPFIGNIQLLWGESNETLLNTVNFLTTNWPTPMRFWLGPKFFVLVNKPEDVQAVFNSPHCLDHSDLYNKIFSPFGDSLFTLNNGVWKTHRRFLNPCFSTRILQSFMPIFNKGVKTLVEQIKLQATKADKFDLYEYLAPCALDMICESFMGTEMNILKCQKADFLDAGHRLQEIILSRMLKPWYYGDFVYKMTRMYREQEECCKIMFGFVRNIIENQKKSLDTIQADDTDGSGSLKKPKIFIEQLLQLQGGSFTDWEVLCEALSMVSAGHDTFALEVSYVILMLAMHPEYQERVFEEVTQILPKKSSVDSLSYEDLRCLELTERAIKETMRLFPVIPLVTKKATSSIDLNGIRIPEGTSFLVSIISMHRDEMLWGPRAQMFDPDRFLDDNRQQMHRSSFLPFAAGPRNCIGFKYAMLSMKVAVAHLIRNFYFTTELKLEGLRLELDITLKLVNKHLVSAAERE